MDFLILLFSAKSAFMRLLFFIKPAFRRLLFFVKLDLGRLLFFIKLDVACFLFGVGARRGGGGLQKRDILSIRMIFPKGVKI